MLSATSYSELWNGKSFSKHFNKSWLISVSLLNISCRSNFLYENWMASSKMKPLWSDSVTRLFFFSWAKLLIQNSLFSSIIILFKNGFNFSFTMKKSSMALSVLDSNSLCLVMRPSHMLNELTTVNEGFRCNNCMNSFPFIFWWFGSFLINSSPAWRFPSICKMIPCSKDSASVTSFSIKSQNFSFFSFVAFSWTPYPTITLIWISPTTT